MSVRNVILLSLITPPAENVVRQITAAGWQVLTAPTIPDAETLAEQHDCRVGLVCLDELPDSALAKAEEYMLAARSVEWIALVSPQTLQSSRACTFIKDLCYDYHRIPVETGRLLFTLGHLYGKTALPGHAIAQEEVTGYQGMIGRCPELRALYGKLNKIRNINEPVLITGESGTGKELTARAIHQLSARRDKPFVVINCGSLANDIVRSPWHDHEREPYSGASQCNGGLIEVAAGGTLFLDEVADFPLHLQIKLLAILQGNAAMREGADRATGTGVRIIAATSRNLDEEVAHSRFREDLYYRINVLRLTIPPLREREGDIELLAQEYFKRFSPELKHTAQGFSAQALQAMKRHPWPGNVRELISRVKHAMIMSQSRLLVPADLGLEVRVSPRRTVTLTKARIKAEQKIIEDALGRNRNNVSETARELGVSRATLYRLMSKLGQALAAGPLADRVAVPYCRMRPKR